MQEKLLQYANQMVSLIAKAEKEGIVLTTAKTAGECLEDIDIRSKYPEGVVNHKLLVIAQQLPLSRLPDVFGGQHHFVKAETMQFIKEDEITHTVLPAPMTAQGLPVVPVYRPGVNDGMFIDMTNIKPRQHAFGDTVVNTAPLKFGVEMDLIGISISEELLDKGLQDPTDSLDASVSLRNIYVEIAENVFEVSVVNHAANSATFDADKHHYGAMKMVYVNYISIDNSTHLISKENSKTSLVKHFLGQASIKLGIRVVGSGNIQLGSLELDARHVINVEIRPYTVEAVKASEQLSHYLTRDTIKLLGYELDVMRINLNRRPCN